MHILTEIISHKPNNDSTLRACFFRTKSENYPKTDIVGKLPEDRLEQNIEKG
jgi:hypothetical protein